MFPPFHNYVVCMKFKVEFKDIGRGKFSGSSLFDAKKAEDLEIPVLRELKKHLISSDISVDFVKGHGNVWEGSVSAGWHTVGKVIIKAVA